MIITNEIDFEECLKDSPVYRYVFFLSFFLRDRQILEISDSLFLRLVVCSHITPTVCKMPSFLNRSQLRQATNNIDMLEDRLEQVTLHLYRNRIGFSFIADVQVVQLCCQQWQSLHSRFSVSDCFDIHRC